MTDDAPPPDELSEPGQKLGGRWLAPVLVVGIAILLLALFYVVENWRGQRAWNKTKAQFAARQQSLEWASYLPTPPPPDELNLMKYPGMEDLFIRGRTNNREFLSAPRRADSTNNIRYGLIKFVSKAEADQLPPGAPLFDFDNLKSDPRIALKISEIFAGRYLATPQGSIISEKKPGTDLKQIFIRADRIPESKDLIAAFEHKESRLPLAKPDLVEKVSSNIVALIASPEWFGAEEMLEFTAGASNVFATIHEAVKRPRCWLPGDYSVPYEIPIPNFVRTRTLAQIRGSRARAHILLNQPDKAFEEIKGIDELNRIMLTEPSVLISAMISVAINNLRDETIKEGFIADVWREEDWRRFQESHSKIKLLPPILESLHGTERAAVCSTMETASTETLPKVFGIDETEKFKAEAVMLRMMPRGWIYQNTAVYARLMQDSINATGLNQPFVDPAQMIAAADRVEEGIVRRSPMTLLARRAIPNFRKASQNAFKSQTGIHQVIVASALERYRKESGSYPESLDQLVPKFLEKVPADLILGEPLRYQKRPKDEYALYSIGWNGVDDLAKALADPGASMHEILGGRVPDADWVWEGIRRKPETQGGAGAAK